MQQQAEAAAAGGDAQEAAAASEEEEEEEEAAPVLSVRNAFAGLLDSDSEGEADFEEESVEAMVVEAQALAQPPPLAEVTDEDEAPPSGGGKKKKKKKKGKQPAAAVDADDEEAALEQMLVVAARENAAGVEASRLAGVWTVASRMLDAEAEQKKLFGARAVRAAQAELAAEDRGGGRNVRGGGAGSRAPKPRRVLLVEPPQSAGRPHGLLKMGMSAEAPVNTVGSAGPAQRVFSFEWSARLESLTRQFASLQQMSADPNLMLELLRHEPCHLTLEPEAPQPKPKPKP